MYELIIIGGGPAGVAAGVYASRKHLKTLFITGDWGGQSIVSSDIQNWIGTPHIAGTDLATNLKKHLQEYAGNFVDIKDNTWVKGIEKDGKNFLVKTSNGESFSSQSILIATGSTRRQLPAIDADKFEHKGLTYCASCDGPMFSGQDVVVAGGGNAALETVAQLTAYANNVTLIHRRDTFRADPVTVEKVLALPKVSTITNAEILKINGDSFVSGLTYKDLKTAEEKDLAITGIFVEIGLIPNTQYLEGVVDLDDQKRVIIDPWTQKTSVNGIWAAGDCTNILYHQNNIAAGDAVRALEDIYITLRTR